MNPLCAEWTGASTPAPFAAAPVRSREAIARAEERASRGRWLGPPPPPARTLEEVRVQLEFLRLRARRVAAQAYALELAAVDRPGAKRAGTRARLRATRARVVRTIQRLTRLEPLLAGGDGA